MGEVAWGAHVEVCCDPGDRDGGLLAECLSDFDFDRIAFGRGTEWFQSSGFRGVLRAGRCRS